MLVLCQIHRDSKPDKVHKPLQLYYELPVKHTYPNHKRMEINISKCFDTVDY